MNAKQTFLKQYWDCTYEYFYTTDAVVKYIRNKEIKGRLSHFFQWVWFFLKTANLQHRKCFSLITLTLSSNL